MNRLVLYIMLFFYCSILYAQKDGWVETLWTKENTSSAIPKDCYEKTLYKNGKEIKSEIYEISYNYNGRVMNMTVIFKENDSSGGKNINYIYGGGFDTILLKYFYYSDKDTGINEKWVFYRSQADKQYYGSVKYYYKYLEDIEIKFEPGEKYIALPHDPDSLFFNIPKVFDYSDSILRLKKIKRK